MPADHSAHALALIAADIQHAADANARRGLNPQTAGGSHVYSRHGRQSQRISSPLAAVDQRERCVCEAVGLRCVLRMDQEDLLCTACRIVCAAEVSDAG